MKKILLLLSFLVFVNADVEIDLLNQPNQTPIDIETVRPSFKMDFDLLNEGSPFTVDVVQAFKNGEKITILFSITKTSWRKNESGSLRLTISSFPSPSESASVTGSGTMAQYYSVDDGISWMQHNNEPDLFITPVVRTDEKDGDTCTYGFIYSDKSPEDVRSKDVTHGAFSGAGAKNKVKISLKLSYSLKP